MTDLLSATTVPGTPQARLAGIDAYRGLVMLLMIGEVLAFGEVAAALPNSGFWAFLAHHQDHVAWVGCSLHDLIQPSFSFLVGVAMSFSLASRFARGQSMRAMTGHALWRTLVLILLGVFLRSTHSKQTNWTFEDTLTQIGLGYLLLFWLARRSTRDQWIALSVILVAYWAAFAIYPLPGPDFEYQAVGVSAKWIEQHGLTGFAAHWQKNSNLAWAFDRWFLNLFPRTRPFTHNGGGYATLSFVPTLGTMILGLIAGGLLRDANRTAWQKVGWLSRAGLLCLAVGWALGRLGICPVVKRIWTPSWVLFSGGWCLLLLAGFHCVADLLGGRSLVLPLCVPGANAIGAYVMAHLWEDFIRRGLTTHLGTAWTRVLGEPYAPLVSGAAVLLILWLVLFWMYRRRLFIKI